LISPSVTLCFSTLNTALVIALISVSPL
jgi:hypothetical protein